MKLLEEIKEYVEIFLSKYLDKEFKVTIKNGEYAYESATLIISMDESEFIAEKLRGNDLERLLLSDFTNEFDDLIGEEIAGLNIHFHLNYPIDYIDVNVTL